MTEIMLVYTVFGRQPTAESTVRGAVEQGLAACANILAPSESFYVWKGLLEKQFEVPVLFKVSKGGVAALVDWIAAHHDYDTPAILTWPATALPAYAQWVEGSVAP